MPDTVWKQNISEDFAQTYEWPQGARIVHAEMQNGRPRVWFQCDPQRPGERRLFRLVPTGGPIEHPERLTHRATFLLMGGEIVAHLYEETGEVEERAGAGRAMAEAHP